MFHSLKENLINTFDRLKSKGFLTAEDIEKAMREIRVILLGADVALSVAKDLMNRVKEKALGEKVLKSIKPGQMIFKIFHDELQETLGSEKPEVKLKSPLTVIMMIGLQGSGKTTSSAKLGLYLRKHKHRKALMTSTDIYRPAAQKQLAILGKQIGIDTTEIVPEQKPLEIIKHAIDKARAEKYDTLIIDTAGRLHTDDELINELNEIKSLSHPLETLLVADSLTGQDAVNIGKQFHEKIGITGVILTRVDGDARGGAALSMVSVTGTPIKFIGVGEKLNDFELFDPKRTADRILDEGDVMSLVEHASEVIGDNEADDLKQKVESGSFDMEDLLKQLHNLKKMGGISKMLGFIPGMGKMKKQLEGVDTSESAFKKQEAIIQSMTSKERKNPEILDASRRKRIAKGSGTQISDINQLMSRYREMKSMMRNMKGKKMKNLEKMLDI